MKIGLVDVDGRHFPNLVLMKISAYHKSVGDAVEFADPMFGSYDRVYMSKVFTFTPDCVDFYDCEVVKGGTGYKMYNATLSEEVEHILPDYDLYKGVIGGYNGDTAYGFLTRGCPNKCAWCVVPKKEGVIIPNAPIEEFLGDKKKAVFLDNNVVSSDWGLTQIERCIDMGVKIDFNQGMDARIIANNPHIIDLLSRVKWLDYIRLACDTKAQLPYIEKCLNEFAKRGIKPYKFSVYTLIKEFDDSLFRINEMKRLGCNPFAQPYLDFDKIDVKQWQRDMARWCNMKSLLKSMDFENYSPRKGFTCREYFNNTKQ